MYQITYDEFKEILDLKHRQHQAIGAAMLADFEEMGKGEEFWKVAAELENKWKEMENALWQSREEDKDGLWYARSQTMTMVEDFHYLPEKKIIHLLKVIEVEVEGYAGD